MIDKLLEALRDMIPNRDKRKKKFFKESKKLTHSEEMQDKLEPIPCPMHEDYDEDVDYREADHLDEIKDVEKMNNNK